METNIDLTDIFIVTPLIAIFIGSLIPLMIKVFNGNKEMDPYSTLSMASIGLVVSFGLLFVMGNTNSTYFYEALKVDSLSVLLGMLVVVCTGVTLFFSVESAASDRSLFSEYIFLILNSALGMLVVLFANDLIVLFIGIEVMSLCLYMAITISNEDRISKESALKYFILGSLASAIFLYGISMIYGSIGSTYFIDIANRASVEIATSRIFLIGSIMITAGLLFKIAAFPFHSWTPDVYQGAPTAMTNFMATGVKVVSVYALFKFVTTQYLTGDKSLIIVNVLEWIAVLTILLGNLAALIQENVKRLLAYSGIAHTGFILIGLLAGGVTTNQIIGLNSISAVVFYLISYCIMTVASFAIVNILEKKYNTSLNLSDLKGLGSKHPWLAFGFTITLLSLAGIPPLLGFFSKFFVIFAALKQGFLWLCIWAVIGSVISVFYYLRPVVNMYFSKEVSNIVQEVDLREKRISSVVVLSSAALIIVLGIFSSQLYEVILSKSSALLP